MPDLTPVHLTLLVTMLVLGAILGLVLRGKRAAREKAAINAGWQEQIEAQKVEHERLLEQNKSLMEQISQLQASNIDAKNRAKELSDAVQEAYSRRDELQRELKDIRTSLEQTSTERDQLRSDSDSATDNVSAEQQQRVERLQTELLNWQNRLPPLIERYQNRDAEARQFENDLVAARARIRELEAMIAHGQTRVEPVEDPETLTDGRDASNDVLRVDQPALPIDEDVIDETVGESTTLSVEAVNDHDVMNGTRDDLQQIKGVGPAIEKTLNELGITRFDQLAGMSEYDIDRVANRLRGFRSRIYREDWIGQARELRDQRPEL